MTTDREVMQQALEALVTHGCAYLHHAEEYGAAINALRARLAEPETCKPALQVEEVEPVAHRHEWFRTGAMEPGQMRCIECGEWSRETAPPARRPLTDEEIDQITRDRWGTQLLGVMVQAHREYARAVERAHKIGGNDD
jgi:hypothetical protein